MNNAKSINRFFTFEHVVINYLFFELHNSKQSTNTKKYKLSKSLIQYHKDFTHFLEQIKLNKNMTAPNYLTYIDQDTPEPNFLIFENVMYDMLESGDVGWENHLFVMRHKSKQINYIMFRLDDAYIVVYAKNGTIYDFKLLN